MNLGTGESLVKVVLDTNVLVSAILFGGKPDQVLYLILDGKIIGIISPVLLAELKEIFSKKFPLSKKDFELTFKNIEEIFEIVRPKETLDIVRDEDDNRVLEAALEGRCSYIVTGDNDLLDLANFKNIKIMTPDEFLKSLEIS